jgi:hypothetical protein
MPSRREIIAGDFHRLLYEDLPAFHQVLQSIYDLVVSQRALSEQEQEFVAKAIEQGAEAAAQSVAGSKLDQMPDELLDQFQASMERVREELKTATGLLGQILRQKPETP